MVIETEKSSFRDPTSRIRVDANGIIYREIPRQYAEGYTMLMKSGLHEKLVKENLMIPHGQYLRAKDFILVRPAIIPFISYPYEWSFNTLKEAALVTLKIAIMALEHGMMLKDASAYNIQFHNGDWKLIDTTSFDKYEEGMPWFAYGQFIRHFYLPLVLCSYCGGKVLKWLSSNIDGLSPHEYANLLPNRSYLNLYHLLHLHFGRSVKSTKTDVKMSKIRTISLLHNLEDAVEKIEYKQKSEWLGYEATTGKHSKVREILEQIGNCTMLDIGTNVQSYHGVAIDKDHDCVNSINKLDALPLVVDICNPTPAIGWNNEERKSFIERANFDVVLALAIVHHLCIANNTPISMVAELMSKLTNEHLIIEFVSEDDNNSKKLALGRTYPEYNKQLFEDSFYRYFRLISNKRLTDTRELYWLRRKT